MSRSASGRGRASTAPSSLSLDALCGVLIRVQLRWGGPGGVAIRRPATPGDPSDPAYNWVIYDRAVRRAATVGIKLIFSIWGTPRWENGGAGYNVAPRSAVDLQQFAVAAANRYSGSYAPPNAPVLPAVKYWLAWNEPNNPVFLKPQFKRVGKTWTFEAAQDYAKICEAVWAGVHAARVTGDKVACGLTAPRGNNNPGQPRASVAPLTFLNAVHAAGLKHFDAAGNEYDVTVFGVLRDLSNPLAAPPDINPGPAAGTFVTIDRAVGGLRVSGSRKLGGKETAPRLVAGADVQRLRDERANFVSNAGVPGPRLPMACQDVALLDEVACWLAACRLS